MWTQLDKIFNDIEAVRHIYPHIVILKNLLEVEETMFYFKLRRMSDPDYNVHIAGGVITGCIGQTAVLFAQASTSWTG